MRFQPDPFYIHVHMLVVYVKLWSWIWFKLRTFICTHGHGAPCSGFACIHLHSWIWNTL